MNPRAVVAVVVLAVLAGGLWWIASLAPSHPASSGAFVVYVVGPDGLLANGTVHLEDADALSALQGLSQQLGFVVEVQDQVWIGEGCTRHYVKSIAGYGETATGGWNYYVRSTGGSWQWQAMGAACRGLQPGAELEWCWVEADVCRSHVT